MLWQYVVIAWQKPTIGYAMHFSWWPLSVWYIIPWETLPSIVQGCWTSKYYCCISCILHSFWVVAWILWSYKHLLYITHVEGILPKGPYLHCRIPSKYCYGICEISDFTSLSHLWASYQICKVVGCAFAGNARNVFPTCDFKENL